MSKFLYVFTTGIFLAFAQLSFFFILESELSSAFVTYSSVTLSWLTGIVAGLWISKEDRALEKTLLLANIIWYWVIYLLVKWYPFESKLFPIYIALIICSGIYAGYFFKINKNIYPNVKKLFVHENNGFLVGMVLCTVGFMALGSKFLSMAYLGLVFVLFFLQRVKSLDRQC